MIKTKIVCTLGPSTDQLDTLEQMLKAGMNVARFNFSHGAHEEHKRRIELLRQASRNTGLPVALLLDTKGPDVRLGQLNPDGLTLQEGQSFTLCTTPCPLDGSCAQVSYARLAEKVKPGDLILIDDGRVQLRAEKVEAGKIHCTVTEGGPISSNKSVNVPGVKLEIPFLRQRDVEDILFGVQMDMDYVAASFTRSAADILAIKKLMADHGGEHIQIIAKLENAEGIDNLDEIIRVSDGVMVARGDMGVEIPFEELPQLQKAIIKKVLRAGKRSITATQMLDSMMTSPRPTRAEITDVANAIYDGTSAIMLSGETAVGKFPVEAVRTMSRIARRTEADIDYGKRFRQLQTPERPNVADAISHATCTTALDLGAAAIVTVTQSGTTARMISKYRPQSPIIGCTPSQSTLRQLCLSWGVHPVYLEEQQTSDELFDRAVEKAVETGLVSSGEMVVITAGLPLGVEGTTNILKVQVVGHVLLTGDGITSRTASGPLCVCKSPEEAMVNLNPGDILVIRETTNQLLPVLRRAAGIVTEAEGASSHAAIVGLTLDLPVVCGATNATSLLKSGAMATLDAVTGRLYSGVVQTGNDTAGDME